MSTQPSQSERIASLYNQLNKLAWPKKYMFKFIMANDQSKVNAVMEVLPTTGTIRFDNSKTGKYVSITCVATMPSAEAVMDVTTKAIAIPGVISL